MLRKAFRWGLDMRQASAFFAEHTGKPSKAPPLCRAREQRRNLRRLPGVEERDAAAAAHDAEAREPRVLRVAHMTHPASSTTHTSAICHMISGIRTCVHM